MTDLRLVPANPDPNEFPHRPYACDVRPRLCAGCQLIPCPFGVTPSTPQSTREP